MCICLWPEFDCPEETLCGWQDIKIQLLLLLYYTTQPCERVSGCICVFNNNDNKCLIKLQLNLFKHEINITLPRPPARSTKANVCCFVLMFWSLRDACNETSKLDGSSVRMCWGGTFSQKPRQSKTFPCGRKVFPVKERVMPAPSLISVWHPGIIKDGVVCRDSSWNYSSHSSGAVWESRWPSWAVRPNEPSGFRGRKAILNHASALVSACP